MSKSKLEKIKEAVRQHVTEYIQAQGIDPYKSFLCPNPEHDDSVPSAKLLPDGSGVWCFSCGRLYDIFDLAHFFEGFPLSGEEFIQENVMKLAERYGIDTTIDPLTEAELYELNTYRAYKLASDLIVSANWNQEVEEEIKKRGWSKELLKANRVGTVESFKWFREKMKSFGFSAQFLDEIDLGKRGQKPSPIFQPHNLIFTITDENGAPVGFAARNLHHHDGDQSIKYLNQATTGVKCNIYKKGKRLYGFDVAKNYETIYIFEGYTDVLTARQHGIDNCCAIGGTALTKDHVLLIKSFPITNVILCLDGDKPGRQRAAEILDKRLSGHKDIRVFIKILPDDLDPDEFLRRAGPSATEEFRKIPELSAFQWRLSRFDDTTDPEEICRTMIPIIVSEPSHITQESMCRDLANKTGWDLQPIRMEVYRLLNEKNQKKEREKRTIVEKTAMELERFPSDAETILTNSLAELTQVSVKYDDNSLSEESTVTLLMSQKTTEEEKEDAHIGFTLSQKLTDFEPVLMGELEGTLLICGGRSNSGKSSFCAALVHDIAINHERNNTICVYHTIDDTPEQILPKFVCLQDGTHLLEINHVSFPNYWADRVNYDLIARRDEAYRGLTELVRNGWLTIKGAFPDAVCGGGNTLSYVNSVISYLRMKYPDRHILYAIDNFHDLQDFSHMRGNNDVARIERLAKRIKAIAAEHHVTILSTMEYTKLDPGIEPNMNNLKGSAALQYVGNIIWHVYNDIHDRGTHEAKLYHIEEREGEVLKLPRLKLIVEKNKVSSFKGSVFLDFYPASSDFERVDPGDIMQQENEQQRETSPEDQLGSIFGRRR